MIQAKAPNIEWASTQPKRWLALHDAAHVRMALVILTQAKGHIPEKTYQTAKRRTLAAAERFGIPTKGLEL